MTQFASGVSVGDTFVSGWPICYLGDAPPTTSYIYVYGNSYDEISQIKVLYNFLFVTLPSRLAGFISALPLSFGSDVSVINQYGSDLSVFGDNSCDLFIKYVLCDGLDSLSSERQYIRHPFLRIDLNDKLFTLPLQCGFSKDSFVVQVSAGDTCVFGGIYDLIVPRFLYQYASIDGFTSDIFVVYREQLPDAFSFVRGLDSRLALWLNFSGDGSTMPLYFSGSSFSTYGEFIISNRNVDIKLISEDNFISGMGSCLYKDSLPHLRFTGLLRNWYGVAIQMSFGANRTIVLGDYDGLDFGIASVTNLLVKPVGIDMDLYGVPVVHYDNGCVVHGEDMCVFGDVLLCRLVNVTGFDLISFGLGNIYIDGMFLMFGNDFSSFGVPSCTRLNVSTLHHIGTSFTVISDVVVNSSWYEPPAPKFVLFSDVGLDALRFGTQWVSHYVRYVPMYPSPVFLAIGAPWASYYVRNVYPSGRNFFIEGLSKVFHKGIERSIELLESVDFAVFGTAEVNVRRIYTHADVFSVFGTDIRVFTNKLEFFGSDMLLYGQFKTWLWRQYAYVKYDCTDLAFRCGAIFGSNLNVFNRNRYINVAGYSMLRFPSMVADIVLGARVTDMIGTDLFSSGRAFIAFYVRYLYGIGADMFIQNPHYTYVYNNARLLLAVGTEHTRFGNAYVELLLRFVRAWTFDAALYGLEHWISYGTRTVEVLTNRGDMFTAGTAVFSFGSLYHIGEDFCIIAAPVVVGLPVKTITPRWDYLNWNANRYGMALVTNRNRMCYVRPYNALEIGLQRIFNYIQFVYKEGDVFLRVPECLVKYNIDYLYVVSLGKLLKYGLSTVQYGWIPPRPPATQMCYLNRDTYKHDMFIAGKAFVYSNAVNMRGKDMFETSTFSINNNIIKILRDGYPHHVEGFLEFGLPVFTYYLQFVRVTPVKTNVAPGISWDKTYVITQNDPCLYNSYMTRFGLPSISPFSIYVYHDEESQWYLIWEYIITNKLYPCALENCRMPDPLFFRVCVGPHFDDYPCYRMFGVPKVYTPMDVYPVVGGSNFLVVGAPSVELYRRPIYVSSFVTLRIPYHNVFAAIARYRDIEGTVFTAYGNVNLVLMKRVIVHMGFTATDYGKYYVDQSVKNAYMNGMIFTLYGGCGIYYNPRFYTFASLVATLYGTSWISFFIRQVLHKGRDHAAYASWFLNSMRVYNRNKIIKQTTWIPFTLFGTAQVIK